MLKKTGTTPKSYAKNVKNISVKVYVCSTCERIIRTYPVKPEKCPFCGELDIHDCVIDFAKEDVNGSGQDQHT